MLTFLVAIGSLVAVAGATGGLILATRHPWGYKKVTGPGFDLWLKNPPFEPRLVHSLVRDCALVYGAPLSRVHDMQIEFVSSPTGTIPDRWGRHLRVAGYYFGGGRVLVVYAPGAKLSNTALAYEVLRRHLDEDEGSHLDPYPKTKPLIEAVNRS